MRLLVDWWARELDTLGVAVTLNRKVEARNLPIADPIIWAIGALPSQSAIGKLRPALFDGIPGTEGLAHGRDILAGTHKAAGRVLVIDEEGGWPAILLVESRAANPDVSSVTVATTE